MHKKAYLHRLYHHSYYTNISDVFTCNSRDAYIQLSSIWSHVRYIFNNTILHIYRRIYA